MIAAHATDDTLVDPPVLVCGCGTRHTFASWLRLPLVGHMELDEGLGWLDLRSCPACGSSRTVLVATLVAVDAATYRRNLEANRPRVRELAAEALSAWPRPSSAALAASVALSNLARVLAGLR